MVTQHPPPPWESAYRQRAEAQQAAPTQHKLDALIAGEPPGAPPPEPGPAAAGNAPVHTVKEGEPAPKPEPEPPPTLDAGAALGFLGRFLRGEPAVLVAIDPFPPGKPDVRYFKTRDGIADQLREWTGRKLNIYFTVNRTPGTKRKKGDITAARAFHADYDPKSPEGIEAWRAGIEEKLRAFVPPPSCIVSSGRGLQAFWLLREPIPVGASNIGKLEACNEALADALGGDHCKSIEHIMRLPGTVNVAGPTKLDKGFSPYSQAKLLHMDETRLYQLANFEHLLPKADSGAQEEQEGAGAKAGSSRQREEAVHLDSLDDIEALRGEDEQTGKLRKLIETGDLTLRLNPKRAGEPYNSRSEAGFAVICKLLAFGVSASVIKGVFLDARWAIGAYVRDKTDPDGAIGREIERAQRKPDAASGARTDNREDSDTRGEKTSGADGKAGDVGRSEKPAAGSSKKTATGSFELREDGVWFNDGEERIQLCGRLVILGLTRTNDSSGWGVLLLWKDADGYEHQWAMPKSMLAGDGTEYRAHLLDGGLYVAPGRRAHALLTTYLGSAKTEARARAALRVGWHGRAFVLPDATYGETHGERLLLQTAVAAENTFRVSGTLASWQESVARFAPGNSRMTFALSLAFAAPLLHLLNAEGGGFHFQGMSSTGKTTVLHAAASAWGGGGINGYVSQWRTTDNGLEGLAARHSDCLLCLDELSQITPSAAGAAAYMLTNGAGKTRADRNGEEREPKKWRVLFLSTGEIRLADKIAEDGRGRRTTAGQQVRVINLAADAGAGLGIFEELHGFPNADAFARHLRLTAGEHYGTAARAFIERLVSLIETAADFTDDEIGKFKTLVPSDADGQVTRVAARFALVAAAGELAVKLGILPWEPGTARTAVWTCFKAWLDGRGGHGPAETADGIRQVRRFIELHGESRFSLWYEDPTARPTLNRAGFRKHDGKGGTEYFVLPGAWNQELCQGFDAVAIARALAEQGLLKRDGADGKLGSRHRLPGGGGPTRCYHLTSAMLGDEKGA